MTISLIETQYLPPISYFSLLRGSDQIIIEKYEHYVKQSYRNRCYINSANKVARLVVPITAKHGKTVISAVKIDYDQKWRHDHWRAIQSSYGKAPFFEYYMHDLHAILFKRHEFLMDLNMSLLSMCLKWLQWEIPITESKAYEKETLQPIKDCRNLINAKNTSQTHKYYRREVYPQVFGSRFVEDLSILDLVFCMGPEANKFVCPPESFD